MNGETSIDDSPVFSASSAAAGGLELWFPPSFGGGAGLGMMSELCHESERGKHKTNRVLMMPMDSACDFRMSDGR